MKKLWYKHGKFRLFTIKVRLPWPRYHVIALRQITHSNDNHVHLTLTHNGKLYGKFYRDWDRGKNVKADKEEKGYGQSKA